MDPLINQPISTPSETGLSQDEMKTNLQDLMSKIEGKYQDFNTQRFSSENKLKGQEGDALRVLFDLFESAGVDPSNPEEVRMFLDNIKQNNPELAQQLEQVLQSILGEEQPELIPAEAPASIEEGAGTNMNTINPNEAIQQNL